VVPSLPSSPDVAISTESLGRRFGERWAVRDLDLELRRGEVFGLLGPNCAG
jgi:ABC-2 type transport system ATP-binding protein